MDHDLLAAQVLRALRAHRSQVQLARRLGYRSNVPASWEAGRSAPPATTFFAACDRLRLAYRPALAAFFADDAPFLDELPAADAVAALVVRLRGTRSTVELAARTGLSRHALGRWQRGQAEPRLPELLLLVDRGTGRLPDFVACFVDPAVVPILAEEWRRLLAGRALLVRSPWVQPVLLALELADYQATPRHDDAWLASRLDLPVEQVTDALAALADTEQITWTGTHWALFQVRTIDTRRDAAGVLQMRAWFAGQALDRLRADQPDALFSQNLFTLSEADLARLRALHVRHFREVQALVAQSEPGERIVLLQRSVIPWDRRPERGP
mgnify:CR=1 FL=1